MPKGGNGNGGGGNGANKIRGNGKDNTLTGTDGVDVILGNGGNDLLFGLAGDDTLEGGDGNDTLEGGAGADLLDGGLDVDTASYESSAAGVTVNLVTGTGTGGDAEGDTLTGIENLTGSAFADVLTGDADANVISGGDGDDTVDGGAGDDVIDGGAGADDISGGAGNDVLTGSTGADLFRFFPLALTPEGSDTITDFEAGVDQIWFDSTEFDVLGSATQLGSDVVISYGSGYTITLQNTLLGDLSASDFSFAVSLPNIINGTDAAEILTGTSGVDWISGFGGDDVIHGLEGADVLSGGAGNDSVFGGDGDDVLSGHGGADYLDGGAGTDTASYQPTGGFGGATVGVTVDLAAGTASGGDGTGDTLVSIENVDGSNFEDTLIGDTGTNSLNGAGGDDVLIGGGGNDMLVDYFGSNVMDGGAGDDLLNVSGYNADVLTGGTGADTFSFVVDGFVAVPGGPPYVTTITDFEIGIDSIEFDVAPFDVLAAAVQQGADVLITYSADTDRSVLLLNTLVDDLQAGDFVFV